MTFAELPAIVATWIVANGVPLLSAIASLLVGLYLSRFAYRTIMGLLPKARGVDKNIGPLLAQIARYGIVVFAIITALNFLGVSNSSVLTVVGAAGLAVALSLQSTLTNIAAGIMLIWLRPIAIGEFITGDGVAGVVMEIGLFGTTLRSTSGLYIFTPNQKLWASAITNHSREPRRRVEVLVTVPDNINVGRARRVLLRVAGADRRVLTDPMPVVHVVGFTGAEISMQLRAWVKTPDYLAALYALTEDAKLALDKEMAAKAGPKAQVGVTPDPGTPNPDAVEDPPH